MVSIMSSAWIGSEWVGRVIDGRFTLQRWLGGAAQSGVFLTQIDGDSPQQAAIKLVSADATDTGPLLDQWTAATHLSHPHVLRLFHAGRDRVDGREVLYVVTEYSEEILAEVLTLRALTPGEVRELLDPVLGTLSWLHIQGLVHGGLKPSNIMVINDQVKLSVDRIQPAGPSGAPFPASGIYDAPGSADKMSPAADVWSLGVLLVEALTQRPPEWNRDRADDPTIPPTVPEPFAAIARECLHKDPARRSSLSQILSQLAPLPGAGTAKNGSTSPTTTRPPVFTPRPPMQAPYIPPPTSSAPPPVISKEPAPPGRTAAQRSLDQSINIFATAALILILAVAALTFVVPSKHSAPGHKGERSASPAERSTPADRPAAPSVDTQTASGAKIPGEVLHRVLPAVSQGALNTIRGHVVVTVRVRVDANGNVSGATLGSAGPSRYFARAALSAAQEWKFRPAQIGGHPVPSTWVLHFGFARAGTDVTSTETTP
jgi:TonB family protein